VRLLKYAYMRKKMYLICFSRSIRTLAVANAVAT
jgi:hypothetical protein